MRFMQIAVCSVLCAGTLAVNARAASAAESTASPAAAYNAEVSIIEHEMVGAVEAMPADKFGFAPSQSIFVPGQQTEFATVRTFAQQATHVAQANYLLYGAASGLKPDVDTAALAKLTRKQDVVAALAASFVFAHKAVAMLTAANAFQMVKSPEPASPTRATVAGFAIAHAFDHYGQIVEYLRMNGIVPPASRK